MKAKLMLVVVCLGATVAGATTLITAAANGAPAIVLVKCTLKLTQVSPASAATGTDIGTASCSAPLGNGLQYNRTKAAVAGNVVTVRGAFKQYFDLGTVHGTYKLAGSTRGTKLTGTATYAGGTGAFANTAGPAKLSCTSSPTSTNTTCSLTATLTGV